MGVPFEALLPYGIMLGVRQWPGFSCRRALLTGADVCIQRRVRRQAQGDAERWKETQARNGRLGQGKSYLSGHGEGLANKATAKYDDRTMTSCPILKRHSARARPQIDRLCPRADRQGRGASRL